MGKAPRPGGAVGRAGRRARGPGTGVTPSETVVARVDGVTASYRGRKPLCAMPARVQLENRNSRPTELQKRHIGHHYLILVVDAVPDWRRTVHLSTRSNAAMEARALIRKQADEKAVTSWPEP